MGPVEVVVEAVGEEPRGKVTAAEILGDVNNDGRVDLGDVLLVMMYSLDPSINIPNIARGDMNNDGRVELIDAYLIITNILNLSDPSLLNPSGNPSFGQHQLTFDGKSLQPAWSPDGQEIAFTYDDGNNVDIHVMDTEGNFLHQVTSDGISSDPAWDEDGDRILFVSSGDIYSINPDGSNRNLLVNNSRNPSVRYSYKASAWTASYYAYSYLGNIEIYFSGQIRGSYFALTEGDEYDYQPDIDPTSSSSRYKIAFTRRTDFTDGEDTWNIHVVDQDGNETQLTYDGVSWGPAWSPTGQYIAFASV